MVMAGRILAPHVIGIVQKCWHQEAIQAHILRGMTEPGEAERKCLSNRGQEDIEC